MIKLTWLGHSAWQIEGSKTVIIDPFLNDSPTAPMKAEDIAKADVVLVSHDHFDHVADAPTILKRTGATLVATYELATGLAEEHGIKAEGANIGGSLTVDGVVCHLVPAWHTAGRGTATGFMIELDGVTIYHTGDTCLFGDMRLLAELFEPAIMLLPIGDRFTMGPPSAARAVAMVRPKVAIPMHYNTWPPIAQDPEHFRALVKESAPQTNVVVLKPGRSFEMDG